MSQENEMLSIDIASLRLPENFAAVHGGAKLPTKASFGKLSKHRFCRTHPGPDYQFPAMIVEDKEGREVYLVHMQVAAHLGPMAKSVVLRLCVDNAGTPKIIAEPILDGLRRSPCGPPRWLKLFGSLKPNGFALNPIWRLSNTPLSKR